MKQIKVGIFGAGRGIDLAQAFMLNGCDIVAICEIDAERRKSAEKLNNPDIVFYDDFDSFIEHDMDAVVLANFFHEHAPYAIKCFQRGIHVFSECISNGTMAEGVELVREAEKSDSIYFLAENYPQMIFNREMTRVCKSGVLGRIVYAEGEYNHPVAPHDVEFLKRYTYFKGHWRNYIPRTYYVTHSLGPVMRATGATPKRVTAFCTFDPNLEDHPFAGYVGDRGAVMLTQNDDGSVFKFVGCSAFGAHGNSYRFCGSKGQIENVRGMGNNVMLRFNSWDIPEGAQETSMYTPGWKDKDEKLIAQTGHGGADFITVRMFVECIREGKQPEFPFDLHSAVAMSSVAILGHRSVLEGGKPYDIPDFTKEEDRKLYENDRLSPFAEDENKLPCCSHTDYKPTENHIKMYEELFDR